MIESALFLSEAELAASRLGSVKTDSLKELWHVFYAALAVAANAGDSTLVQRLSSRYLSSPLGQLLAHSQFEPLPDWSIQPRPVLLFDAHRSDITRGKGAIENTVDRYIRRTLEQSHVAYTPVPLFEVDAARLGVERVNFKWSRGEEDPDKEHSANFTSYLNLVEPVCILPVPSGLERSEEILSRFNAVCINQPDRLVVGERFDPGLNNLTFSQHGRYVPIEGLGPAGFMGAVFNGWPKAKGLPSVGGRGSSLGDPTS